MWITWWIIAYLAVGFVIVRFINRRYPRQTPLGTFGLMVVWPLVLIMFGMFAIGRLGGGE
jgi:Na+/proline symporter